MHHGISHYMPDQEYWKFIGRDEMGFGPEDVVARCRE